MAIDLVDHHANRKPVPSASSRQNGRRRAGSSELDEFWNVTSTLSPPPRTITVDDDDDGDDARRPSLRHGVGEKHNSAIDYADYDDADDVDHTPRHRRRRVYNDEDDDDAYRQGHVSRDGGGSRDTVVAAQSVDSTSYVDLALYTVSGIVIIFVLEQFIAVGTRLAAASAYAATRNGRVA